MPYKEYKAIKKLYADSLVLSTPEHETIKHNMHNNEEDEEEEESENYFLSKKVKRGNN